ncbi:peptidoglycan DD-metalloendopeptidase family protein [Paraherbaspirillum soli]|uniref:Peptidoglycan DD-metalloendopeptidase family protein n=1 Tax=Paraherbaspirillum soli TaxID=631222 RepID=A0ABW0MEM5_9BURK
MFPPRLYLSATAMALLSLSCLGPASGQVRPVEDDALRQTANSAFAASAGVAAATSATDTVVEVSKTDSSQNWILGSVTQKLAADSEADPLTRLFLAHRVNGKWQLGLEASDVFFKLLESAPDEVLSPVEKANFRAQRSLRPRSSARSAAGDTGLALPWQQGTAWYWTGGAHGWSGDSRPFNSLDFSGGDGRVLAARDGTIYKSCENGGSAIVKLVHDNGYATTYYHMTNLSDASNGTLVRMGTYIGMIGNALPCGGHTSGAHVHLSLSKDGNEVAVNGKTIGGWQFFEGQNAYGGYAVRNARRVSVQASLTNYGPDNTPPPPPGQPQPGTVQARGAVNLRNAPSLSADIIGSLQNGAKVLLACYAYGDSVDGNWGKTTLWYKLTTKQWISDGFVNTGSNNPVVAACLDS